MFKCEPCVCVCMAESTTLLYYCVSEGGPCQLSKDVILHRASLMWGDKKVVAGHIPQGFINYRVQYTICIKYCTNHGLISIIES